MDERDPNGLESPKLVVVGSGTAAPDGEHVCAGYWLESSAARVLFDCGAGVVHNMARFDLPWQRITHLFLTHFHNDHIGDVPMLLFALKYGMQPGRTMPLSVIGPAGTHGRLAAMAGAFGEHVTDPGFPLHVHELADGEAYDADDIRISVRGTPHTQASLACRADGPGLAIGYTGDTGPSAALGAFFRGVDDLIAECSLPDALAMPNHLTPRSLAAIALQAEPRRLVVTHVYPQLDRNDVPALLGSHGWKGDTVLASDGLRLR